MRRIYIQLTALFLFASCSITTNALAEGSDKPVTLDSMKVMTPWIDLQPFYKKDAGGIERLTSLTIGLVTPGSSAEKAGFKNGQEVLFINSVAIPDLTRRDFLALLAPSDLPVSFTVKSPWIFGKPKVLFLPPKSTKLDRPLTETVK